jgi:hypothetical protein
VISDIQSYQETNFQFQIIDSLINKINSVEIPSSEKLKEMSYEIEKKDF